MSKAIRKRVIVSGRVQGVNFRAFTRAAARKAGTTGWVRNLPDGRVEAVFEGEPEQVNAMLAWMHRGSPYGRVEEVTAYDEPPTGEFHDFDISYTRGDYW